MFSKNIPQTIKENVEFGTSVFKTVQSSLRMRASRRFPVLVSLLDSYFTGGKPPALKSNPSSLEADGDTNEAPKPNPFPIFNFLTNKTTTTDSNASNAMTPTASPPTPSLVREGYPPFYKRVPQTDFLVDSFSYQYTQMAGRGVYFLTHFHSDHYGRLDSSYNWGPLCMLCWGVVFLIEYGVGFS
jgi:hypothetical protein